MRDRHQDYGDGTHERRFKLKVRHVILGLIAVLALAAVLHVALLGSRANQRLEALRAAGQPTSLAELALRNKLPMGMENAAAVYQSAFAAYVRPDSDANVPYLGRGKEPHGRAEAFPEDVAKAIADTVAANEKCLALLHQAAGLQNCRYDYDYRQDFPHFKEIRGCALLLKLAAIHHAQKGDADAAIASIKDALRLGDSLEKEQRTLAYLVHSSCIGVAITALERALSTVTFTDAQLRDLDDAFAASAGTTNLAQALIGERCFLIDVVRDPSLGGITGPGAMILKLPGIQSRGFIDLLDNMAIGIEAADLPPVQQAARFREAQKQMDDLSILHLVAKIHAPGGMRFGELNLRRLAHMDLVRTSLAIERFRLANGKVPEQLTDLVPKYLEQAPLDPFDGQPIRYRRTEPGYVLYSVREDGQDNGGKEQHEVDKGQPYDLCFIVAR